MYTTKKIKTITTVGLLLFLCGASIPRVCFAATLNLVTHHFSQVETMLHTYNEENQSRVNTASVVYASGPEFVYATSTSSSSSWENGENSIGRLGEHLATSDPSFDAMQREYQSLLEAVIISLLRYVEEIN